jgi:hypothetical protein
VSCGGPSFEDVAAEKIHIRPYNHPESLLALRLLKAQSIGASCYLQPYLPSIDNSSLSRMRGDASRFIDLSDYLHIDI